MAQTPVNPHQGKPKLKPVSETRKIRKPLMERKRRERINVSLTELARLLTEAQKVKTGSGGGKPSKLEKADILELTVKHLQSLGAESRAPQEGGTRYIDGFSECIKVVEKTLAVPSVGCLRERVLSHLNSRLKILKSSCRKVIARERKGEEEKENMDIEEEKKEEEVGKESSTTFASQELPLTEGQQQPPKCSFTLVPTELPDGGMAFVLSGNTQKLLKEWGTITSEARTPVPPAGGAEDTQMSSSPAETKARPPQLPTPPSPPLQSPHSSHSSQELQLPHSSQSQQLPHSSHLPQSSHSLHLKKEMDDRAFPTIFTQYSPAISPSTSFIPPSSMNLEQATAAPHSQLTLEQNTKTYHTLQPISSPIYYISTSSSPDDSTPPLKHANKSQHCPPTPPPSPPTSQERGSKSLPSAQPSLQHVPVLAHRQLAEHPQGMEVEYELNNEPFDLSMARMWRPW